jgi:hypothetical protein
VRLLHRLEDWLEHHDEAITRVAWLLAGLGVAYLTARVVIS